MADFDGLRPEEWNGEIELMEKLHLLSHFECWEIQMTRKEHFDGMAEGTKDKEDFKRFIGSELALLKKLKRRRFDLKLNDYKEVIDFKIMERVKYIYVNCVLVKFPTDLELWYDYFNFCRKVKFWESGSEMLQKMTYIHGDKEMTWKHAADWEIDSKHLDRARSWLIAGTEKHPASAVIHTELIKMELELAKAALRYRSQRKRKRNELDANRDRKRILRGEYAEIAYKSAVGIINDASFCLNILKLVSNYPAATNLRDLILEDMKTKFPDDEVAWNFRARQPFEEVVPESTAKVIDFNKGIEIKGLSMEKRIKQCVETYEEAIQRLPSKKKKMWSFYLDFLEQINRRDTIAPCLPAEKLRQLCWKRGMEAALKAKEVNEQHFLCYVDHLRWLGGHSEEILSLLVLGTKTHPNSAKLWLKLVRYYLKRKKTTKGMDKFRTANKYLMKCPAEQVLPLWITAINYMMKREQNRVEALFLEGIGLRSDLGHLLKLDYFFWKVQGQGIGQARKLLLNPLIARPAGLQLYQELIKFECSLPEPCLMSIRNCCETSIRHFGHLEAAVWIDYLKFELTMGNKDFVANVHRRACDSLTGDQLETYLRSNSVQDIPEPEVITID